MISRRVGREHRREDEQELLFRFTQMGIFAG
jgi:hypothetical protein